MSTLSSFLVPLGLIAVIVVVSVVVGWSHRRTRNQARLMKKSLGMHVSDDVRFDGDSGGGDSGDGGGD